MQGVLLTRAGELSAPALLASLLAVLRSSSNSSVITSKAAVVGALAQALVAADWSTLSA
jgi:hypothetical protein